MAEKEEKKEEQIELIEVPTQTAQLFKLPDGKIISLNEYLVYFGNQINKLIKVWGK